MLASRPRYHTGRQESHAVLALLFLILDLVTAVTGRDCDYQIIERDDQLRRVYPVNAPAICATFELLLSANPFAGEPVYKIEYM